MTSQSDHDLLVALGIRVEYIKENMPTKQDIYDIVSNKIDEHCQNKHSIMPRNSKGSISWGTVAKILVGLMPPLLVLAGIVFSVLNS